MEEKRKIEKIIESIYFLIDVANNSQLKITQKDEVKLINKDSSIKIHNKLFKSNDKGSSTSTKKSGSNFNMKDVRNKINLDFNKKQIKTIKRTDKNYDWSKNKYFNLFKNKESIIPSLTNIEKIFSNELNEWIEVNVEKNIEKKIKLKTDFVLKK